VVQNIALVALVAIAVAAGYLDVRFRRLPNWLSLICAAAGLGFAFSIYGSADTLWHLAHGALALAIGMALFAARMWGGGDAKYYAASAFWFPLEAFFHLVWWISLTGLALVILALLLRGKATASTWLSVSGVPYGVAIGAGTVVTWATIGSLA
jgi:prepilin peptidase CpaA